MHDIVIVYIGGVKSCMQKLSKGALEIKFCFCFPAQFNNNKKKSD